jgi:hypothetical protein
MLYGKLAAINQMGTLLDTPRAILPPIAYNQKSIT